MNIGSGTALVASIADLLEMKRSTGRDKDQLDIEALEAIRRLERRMRRRARASA
jgi:hypothetical protein